MYQMMGKANQDEVKSSLSCDQDYATKSQFVALYQSKLRPEKLDKPTMVHNFHQDCVQHNEYTFKSFSYDVEKVLLAFEYYKLHVKIGHFSLTANVLLESCPNPLKRYQNKSGKYGTAYFTRFNEKLICFKSTNYHNEKSFHEIFPRVIKEWSILKICSVINCSPRVDPYLGFDIIVYTDCVQYAMERGRPIERLTKAYANILKEKLWTMHQLNIIHFDIKPENIVISEELNEPVFIDFGLSEIVKEGCGLKTFCAFRGTPNYCSPEMMGILGKEPAFVDLYYNDACGLETTIQKQSLRFQDEAVDEVAQFQMDDDQNDLFYFYAFQFHYLQQNQLQASQQLDRYIQAKGNIKLVLFFIKKMVNYVFLSSIFKKLLVLFSSLSEYSEIEDEIRLSTEMYFSKMHLFWSKFVLVESNEDTKNELKLQSYESQKVAWLPLGNDYKQYLDLLLNISELGLQNIQQYLQLAFSCIRFDISNLSLPDKAAIAIKINKLILQHRNGQTRQLQIRQKSELDHVRLLIRLILEECLSSYSTTKWAKDSIFDIFQQVIMVDIDITPYIQTFMSFVSKNFRSQMDTILALLELMRLSEALRMVLTDHFESVQIVKKELCIQITVLFEQYEVRSKQLIDPQINMIRKIVRQYMSEYFYQNTAEYASLKNNLKLVKHAKIQKYLLYFMTAKQTEKLFNFTNNDVIFLMIGEMRTMLSSLDFFSSIKITVLILQSTNRFGDIKTYSDQIKKIVNCQEVYERINLDFGAIDNPARRKYFARNLEIFAKQYKQICSLNYQSYIYLRQFILENHKGSNLNNHEARKWFIHIYPTFCEQVESKCQTLDELQAESFSIVTFLFEISWFYYKLSKQTQGLFLGQINKFEAKLQQPLNDIPRFKKRPLVLFQKCLFLYQLYYSQGNYLECLECLDTIILICTRLRLKRLTLEFMRQHISISNRLNDESRIIRSSMQLFDFCFHRHFNFSSFYLQPTNFINTFTLFVVLARNEPSKLRKLLKTFIDFLQQHPVQSYFASLFTIISHFLKMDPSFGYVIHINHFQIDQLSLPLNPYALIFIIFSLKSEDGESQRSLLKAIAINIDRINWFVKKTILRQYFIIFMKLLQEKSLRQKTGNFRMAKVYLSSKERKKMCKQLSRYQLRRQNEKKCIQSKLMKYMLKM